MNSDSLRSISGLNSAESRTSSRVRRLGLEYCSQNEESVLPSYINQAQMSSTVVSRAFGYVPLSDSSMFYINI